MAGLDFDAELKQLDATMTSIEKVLDLPALRKEIDELGEQVAAPDLWDDQANAQKVTSRLSSLQADVERVTNLRSRLDDVGALVELGREENDADSLTEAEKEMASVAKSIQSLEVRTLLSGEYDEREALVTIRSGAGGVDAADFAEMLQRMYLRYAERHGYPTD
ncbi:MAG TPA: PCRF domain-containing protein, partial [Kribbella sp.]|nr:PCRF domain-containing protein [Kribbella sp.]